MIKQRILLVGSNGMLGQRIAKLYKMHDNIELLLSSAEDESHNEGFDYKQIDLTEKSSIKKIITNFYPDTIINTAAYTNVDGCETEKELSWKINVTGVELLAKYGKAIDSHLIHVSTDYVFDGKNGPYSEKDKVNPISYYGRGKLAAENVLVASPIKSTIVRTNVLYGPAKQGRPDFVKWVVTSLRAGKNIKIVDDQINNPTYLDNLAWALSKFAYVKKEGLYNIGGSDFLDRFEFTMRIADFFKLDKSLVSRIKTEELKQAAPRPLKSGLINLKAETEIGYKPTPFEDTFALMQEELGL